MIKIVKKNKTFSQKKDLTITDEVIKCQRIKFFLKRMEREESFNIARNI